MKVSSETWMSIYHASGTDAANYLVEFVLGNDLTTGIVLAS